MIFGEVTSKAKITTEEIEKIIRDTIKEIGYDGEDLKFDGANCEVISKLHSQSPDIKQGVDGEKPEQAILA